ncbi:hypothetical protein EMPS_03900 [Entomortierella parvispora]|uniref:Uncharacterized protein n=1 Tax=Entomortierella parvispora TaxID=205924 RepID=A0A9P3H7K6_9FUNG|nr:hypothetical protein EMPS_03900 [Entomortierella parvispora]
MCHRAAGDATSVYHCHQDRCIAGVVLGVPRSQDRTLVLVPLSDTALTPISKRPRYDTNSPHPLIKGRTSNLDKFFYDEMLDRWLPEVYAAQNGGDTKAYVEGVRVMSEWQRFSFLLYCESNRGQKQLELLQSCSSLQVVSDDLAVSIKVQSVGSYKEKVQQKSGLNADSGAGMSSGGSHSSSFLASAPPRSRAEETYGKHDFDNLLFSPKKNSSGSHIPPQSDAEVKQSR